MAVMRKTLEDERDAVDLITDCMYSARFLHDIGEVRNSHTTIHHGQLNLSKGGFKVIDSNGQAPISAMLKPLRGADA